MQDEKKTKKQLIEELSSLRRRVSGIPAPGNDAVVPDKSPAQLDDIYRLAVEHSNDGVVIVTGSKRLYCNRKYAELSGYRTPEEIEDKPFLFNIHPDDRVRVKETIIGRHKGKPSPPSYECRFLKPDGTVVYVEISASVVNYKGVSASLGFIRDITEKKRIQEKLEKSERKYRSVVENIKDAYYRTDLEGFIIMGNPAGMRMFGYDSFSEKDRVHINSFWPNPDDRDRLIGRGLPVNDYETVLLRKDGSPLQVSLSFDYYYDDAGNILGTEGIIRDITRRKKAEEKLREAEIRYRNILENTGTVMLIVEEDMTISFTNAEFEKMTGFKREEIEGKKKWTEFVVRDDLDRMVKQHRLRRSDEGEAMRAYEFRLVRKDGNIRNIYLTADIIPGTKQSVCSLMDVTELKKTQEELAVAQEKFSTAFNLSPVMLVITDINTNHIVEANRAFLATAGYAKEDLFGRTAMDLGIWADSAKRDYLLSVVREKGECIGVDTRMRRRDGSLLDVRVSTTVISFQGISQLLTVIEDLSEIKNQEARFSALVEKMSDVVSILDERGVFIYNTPSAEKVFGYPVEYLAGRSAFEIIHPDDLEEVMVALAEVADLTNTGVPTAFRVRKGDGSWIHMEALGSNMLQDPNIRGIVITSRDVTLRKCAEEALRESESKFRDLAEKSIVGIYLIQEGLFRYVNSMFAEIFDYAAEEIIDKLGPVDVLFPDDWPLVNMSLNKRLQGDIKSLRYDFRVVTKNKEIKCAEVYSSRTIYKGKPAVIGTLLDITERRKAEQELRRLSAAVEQAAEEVIITDAEGIIQYVNPAFEKITGYPRQEAIGCTPRILKSGVHDLSFYKNLWDTIKDGRVWAGRITNRRKDGRLIQEDANISPLSDASGRITGFVSLKRDITDEVNMEAQLFRAQKMEAVGTLAAGIAHDFNNILTGIHGYATLIQFGLSPDHPHYKKLEGISSQVMSGANLTRQLLGFARGGKYEVKATDLNELLEKSSEMFGRTNKGIGIVKRFQPDIWTVEVDQGQIEQVLLNVFINAAHAMSGEGDIYLQTENVEFLEDDLKPHDVRAGRYVRMSVTDTGIGMDKAVMEKIFDPFFSTKGPGKGTGLGLASAYGIIRNHEGFITVYSEPGKGATFNICLPASGQMTAPDDIRKDEILRGQETILIVDDEQLNVLVTREILESLGYHVFSAGSGQEAMAVFMEKGKDIDLIILDMVMPGMGGSRTFDALRKINPDIRIILASGYTVDGEAQQLLGRGCNGFIQKPYRIQDLSKKIREVLENRISR